jgi:hypothetical protein
MSAALESVVIGSLEKVAIFATSVPNIATIIGAVKECKRPSRAFSASLLRIRQRLQSGANAGTSRRSRSAFAPLT